MVLQWMDLLRSFLQCRSQSVIIAGIQKSQLKQLPCGVPQGSLLSPIELVLFIHAPFRYNSKIPLSSVSHHIYADDTQIYMYFKLNDPQFAIDNINKCISDLRVWMIMNHLKINET